MIGGVHQVLALLRVVHQIEQQAGILLRIDEFVGAAPDHHQRAEGTFGHVFAEHLVMPLVAGQVRQQRATIERQVGLQRAARQLNQGRQQVGGRHRGADPCRIDSRGTDDQRHASGHLEPVHLVPEAPLAQLVTMVTGEHHDGVLGQAARLERFQQLANVVVDVAAGAEVSAAGVLDLLFGQRFAP